MKEEIIELTDIVEATITVEPAESEWWEEKTPITRVLKFFVYVIIGVFLYFHL